MRQEDREKLEQVEELLEKLEDDFLSTYGQIRAILDTISGKEEEDAEGEEDWDLEEDEEVFGEVVIDLDELFGEDDEV